ncbi:hypothetical protein BKA63DRAFT_518376 [Paraphoma chrysanthemicola]|nr:hypothetical protein BKA63DRAFT_518376 [Paraphoma chrysanthemicola]
MLGQVLYYLRLHAVLSSIMPLLSLHNAIQCRRSWQPCGRCGWPVRIGHPASSGETLRTFHFSFSIHRSRTLLT